MAHRLGIAFGLLAVLALASCGGGGDSGSSSNYVLATSPHVTAGAGTGTGMTVAQAALAADAFNWVNGHRVANGLPAIAWHGPLAEVARAHSNDMFTRTFFDHVNPDGHDAGWRVSNAGIAWTGVGENIAYNQQTGQEVSEDWMNSDGHRANILNGNWTAAGLGVHTNGSEVWWTHVFIR